MYLSTSKFVLKRKPFFTSYLRMLICRKKVSHASKCLHSTPPFKSIQFWLQQTLLISITFNKISAHRTCKAVGRQGKLLLHSRAEHLTRFARVRDTASDINSIPKNMNTRGWKMHDWQTGNLATRPEHLLCCSDWQSAPFAPPFTLNHREFTRN